MVCPPDWTDERPTQETARMSVLIREYTPADLEVCRDLWRDLTQRHRDIYEDPTIGGDDPGPYFDEHYLTDPKLHKVWVAELDGEVVGLTGLFFADGEAELEPIVVRPHLRSSGIGEQLAKRVVDEARELTVRYLNVRPVPRNLEAIAFFYRAGFDLLGRFELSMQLDPDAFPAERRTVEIHGHRFKF